MRLKFADATRAPASGEIKMTVTNILSFSSLHYYVLASELANTFTIPKTGSI